MDRGGRVKLILMLSILAGSLLALVASTQVWFSLHLTSAANHTAPVTVQGSVAAPALTALSLAGLALAAALAIAGRIARVVLGVLGALLGACILLSAGIAVGAPEQAGTPAVTTVTGVSGTASVRHLVAGIDSSVWPWVAIVGGAMLVVAGIAVLVTSRSWPGASRRYQAVRFEPADDSAAAFAEEAGEPGEATPSGPASRDAAIDNWDELSRGEDPTR
ncbi:MAG: hypothetical protein QOF36_1588 [Microbacteriaceae bacterium]|nr:hypothetical protein [Microbacteriaceae bacterium]